MITDAIRSFDDWLMSRTKLKFLYHVGNLLRDRLSDPKLDALAKHVWAAHISRKVLLVQKKGPSFYFYSAIRRRKP